MPRKPSTEKSPVSVALILMRQQLGMTQVELAGHLRVALSTIGRWESWDPPKGIILERLARFAHFNELPVAAALQHELDKEESRAHPAWFRLQSDEEAKYVRATLLILRDPMYGELRPKLRRFMASALKAPDFQVDEDPDLRQLKAEAEAEGVPESPLRQFRKVEQERIDRYNARKEQDERPEAVGKADHAKSTRSKKSAPSVARRRR